jgi:hypothetical protein
MTLALPRAILGSSTMNKASRQEGIMLDIVSISAAADQMRKQRLAEAARDRSIRKMKKARK